MNGKQVVRVRGRPRQGSDQSLRVFSAVPAVAEAASTTSEAATGECPEKEGLQVMLDIFSALVQLLPK